MGRGSTADVVRILSDLVTVIGMVDEPLFADFLVVVIRGLLFVLFFTLVTVCDISLLIGMGGCAAFCSLVVLVVRDALPT